MASRQVSFRRIFFSSVLSVFILLNSASFAKSQEEADAGSTEDAEADPYALSQQWEEYGKSVAAALSEEKAHSAALESELETLKARITSLEASLGEKEKVVDAYESELKGVAPGEKDLAGQLKKLLAKAAQYDTLEGQVKQLEKRAEAAEKAAAASEEQKKKLLNAESALAYAKRALLKAEQEAVEKGLELKKISGSLLPHWAKEKLAQMQTKASFHWEEYGKPAFFTVHKKASEGAAAASQWASPHIATVQAATVKVAGSAADALHPVTKFVKEQHKKLSPVVQKHWETTSKTLQPHLATVRAHVHKHYKTAAEYAAPHIEKVSKFSQPYVEVVRSKSQEAYAAAYKVVGPHVEKVAEAVQPHVGHIHKTASEYHEKLQGKVKETLEAHSGITDASPAFVWYLASALVLLPLLLGFVVSWPLVSGQKKLVKAKPVKHKKPHHQRRTKRD